MEQNVKYLKWGILSALGFGIAYFALPILASMAINAVTIAVSGIALLGIWIFLPAISEVLAQLSATLWEKAIRTGPIQRLNRDLQAHAKDIDKLENEISISSAAVANAKQTIRDNARLLSPEDKAQWEEQLGILVEAGQELIALRDAELQKHERFKLAVEKAKADLSIGRAFSSAAGAFAISKKVGQGSQGSTVALDQVRKELSESQGKIATLLSRKSSVTSIGFSPSEVIDTPVKQTTTIRVPVSR